MIWIAALFLAVSAFAEMDTDRGAPPHVCEKYGLARPEPEGYGLHLSFSALYWRSNVSGTAFVLTNRSTSNDIPINGDFKTIKPSWDWGFSAGAGYAFTHDGWDLDFQYTYFKNNRASAASVPEKQSLIPLRTYLNIVPSTFPTFQTCNEALSRLDHSFQNIELQIGRNYFVSEFFALRPSIGTQTAWIDFKQRTNYSKGDLGNHLVQVVEESNFWGMGPQLATQGHLFLSSKISFFSALSGALLYARYHTHFKNKFSADSSTSTTLNANTHTLTPTVRLLLAIRYSTYVRRNQQYLALSLGCDTQYWWGVRRAINPSNPYNSIEEHNDALQGITANICWYF